jgi:hypothetical protein
MRDIYVMNTSCSLERLYSPSSHGTQRVNLWPSGCRLEHPSYLYTLEHVREAKQNEFAFEFKFEFEFEFEL